jgi:hypothetical protein
MRLRSAGDYDFEGVAARPEGGFWFASEGRTNAGSSRPNLIVRANQAGTVLTAVPLPAGLAAGATSNGFEGVAVTGTAAGGDETVWVAVQREWADDPAGFVKIGRYHVATGDWTFARYPLETTAAPPAAATIGLSEITPLPNGDFAIIERDNQLGQEARIKRIYEIDPDSVQFQPVGQSLPVLSKTLFADVIGDLRAASITVPDKLEGVAVTTDRRLFLVTDNDGVDENYGETVFLQFGRIGRL